MLNSVYHRLSVCLSSGVKQCRRLPSWGDVLRLTSSPVEVTAETLDIKMMSPSDLLRSTYNDRKAILEEVGVSKKDMVFLKKIFP